MKLRLPGFMRSVCALGGLGPASLLIGAHVGNSAPSLTPSAPAQLGRSGYLLRSAARKRAGLIEYAGRHPR